MSRDTSPIRLGTGRWLGEVPRSLRVPGAVFCDLVHDRPRALPEHRHERAFLCLLLAGAYVERRGRRVASYAPGTLLFQPPGLEHADQIGGAGARFFTVEIETESILELLAEGHLPAATVEVRGGRLPRLAADLRRAALATATPDLEELEQRVTELLGAVTRPIGSRSPPPPWLDRVEEAIRADFRHHLTVAALARQVGVHPVHLSRVFRRHHGISPIGRVHQHRVHWAAERLRDPGRTTAEVAREAGFADASHMTRSFRRLTAGTPGALRDRERRQE